MLRDPSLIPLSHEHQHALALCVLVERGLAADPDAAGLQLQVQNIVGQFDSEMRKHFELEEQILFPVAGTFPSLTNLVSELEGEHRHMRRLVEALRSAPQKEIALEFSNLLRRHVRKEESVLFEEAQRVFSREQIETVGDLLRRGGHG
jgi:hemerythrin-like domain-containing protein